MATTTPNFGWPVPTSTDLVKDGATAIEALGDSIDASLLDLKGGTTGQVLSKNTNTDMDFVWVTDAAGDITGVTAGTGISGGGTSGTVTVTNSMATALTTKGDLVVGTGSGTFVRQGVGTNGQVLTADSAEAGGVKWATADSAGLVLITSGNFSASSSFTIDNCFSATYAYYKIIITNTSGSGGAAQINLNFRTGGVTNTASTYNYAGTARLFAAGTIDASNAASANHAFIWRTNGSLWAGTLEVLNPFASERTWFTGSKLDTSEAGTVGGYFDNTTSFDGFSVNNTGSTNIAGNVRVYGYKN